MFSEVRSSGQLIQGLLGCRAESGLCLNNQDNQNTLHVTNHFRSWHVCLMTIGWCFDSLTNDNLNNNHVLATHAPNYGVHNTQVTLKTTEHLDQVKIFAEASSSHLHPPRIVELWCGVRNRWETAQWDISPDPDTALSTPGTCSANTQWNNFEQHTKIFLCSAPLNLAENKKNEFKMIVVHLFCCH